MDARLIFALCWVGVTSSSACCKTGPEKMEVGGVDVVETTNDKALRVFRITAEARPLTRGYVTIESEAGLSTMKTAGNKATVDIPYDSVRTDAPQKVSVHLFYEAPGLLGCNRKEVKEVRSVELLAKDTLLEEPSTGIAGGSVRCRSRKCEAKDNKALGAIEYEFTAPAGSTVEFGSVKEELPSGSKTVKLELLPYLAKVPTDRIGDDKTEPGLSIPVTFRFPDKKSVSGMITYAGRPLRLYVTRLFEAFATKPVLFPGEKVEGSQDASIIILSQAMESPAPILHAGAVGPLTSVDLVALIDNLPERRRPCGAYGATGQGSFSVTFSDVQASVFDRRTKALKGRRVFPAPPMDCPSSIRSDTSGSSYNSRAKPQAAIDYAKSFVKR